MKYVLPYTYDWRNCTPLGEFPSISLKLSIIFVLPRLTLGLYRIVNGLQFTCLFVLLAPKCGWMRSCSIDTHSRATAEKGWNMGSLVLMDMVGKGLVSLSHRAASL